MKIFWLKKCWSNHNLLKDQSLFTGDHIKLQQLLKSSYFNPNSVDLKDRYGRTPLIFSVLGDHNECTEILLKVCYFKIIYKEFSERNLFFMILTTPLSFASFYQLHLWKRNTKQNLKFNMLSVPSFLAQ